MLGYLKNGILRNIAKQITLVIQQIITMTNYFSFNPRSLIPRSSNLLSAQEKRLRINASPELVVYRPSQDTVDICQYVTSEKYTGRTRKGIRITNENVKKIVERL